MYCSYMESLWEYGVESKSVVDGQHANCMPIKLQLKVNLDQGSSSSGLDSVQTAHAYYHTYARMMAS